MPSILNLKFKGNKSFVAFSNLNDGESLTQTWKVCTKVASYLEQGQRLENLSWRLWHLQSLIVDSDNAKSKREFKKLSRVMGDKLDKEKGRSIEELSAPDFKRNASSELIKQRAVEKEKNREASQHAQPGTIKRMQFTFSVDQPAADNSAESFTAPQKPDNKPMTDFVVQRQRQQQQPASSLSPPVEENEDDMVVDSQPPVQAQSTIVQPQPQHHAHDALRFPTLFSNDFGPSALLHPSPTFKNSVDYGEDHTNSHAFTNDAFSIVRPTIELPLDDIISSIEGNNNFFQMANYDFSAHRNFNTNIPQSTSSVERQRAAPLANAFSHYTPDVAMSTTPTYSTLSNQFTTQTPTPGRPRAESSASDADNEDESSFHAVPAPATRQASSRKRGAPSSGSPAPALPKTVAPSKVNAAMYAANSTSAPARQTTPRPHLTIRTGAPGTASASTSASARTPTVFNEGVGAPTTISAIAGRSSTAPGGIKAECSNCGATHTPLWRRGLNDELNCNACGLYCKLHKRPRPRSMRNTHGEGRTQVAPRQEAVDVMAQCYNCHTTATPLWRKDDEGRTVCNACGLYYKLHGSSRPISMKSDVIRKRSRHDARRSFGGEPTETPSASPGVSRRASPDEEPILAPDSSTYGDQGSSQQQQHHIIQRNRSHSSAGDGEYSSNQQSELLGALGHDQNNLFHSFQFPNSFATNQHQHQHRQQQQQQQQQQHPQQYATSSSATRQDTAANDPLPFAGDNQLDLNDGAVKSPRVAKRRRMSTDSLSEPPSSAISLGSYDGYSSSTSISSAHSSSAHSSIDWGSFAYLPFQQEEPPSSMGPSPHMGPSHEHHTPLFHPPMLPPSMIDFSSSGMSAADEENMFSMYLHPPMTIPEEMSTDLLYPMPQQSGSSSNSSSSGAGEYDANMRIY